MLMIKGESAHWRQVVATLAIATGVLACGSDDPDEDANWMPPLLEPFCQQAGSDTWSCEDQSITLKAFLDRANLPRVYLVSHADDFGNGNEMLPILHPDGSMETLTTGYAEDLEERIAGPPIKGEVTEGIIRKVMQPGNGVSIATWHIEIASSDFMRYFTVLPDGSEQPIER